MLNVVVNVSAVRLRDLSSVSKLNKKRLYAVGIKTVQDMIDAWNTVVPEVIGVRHKMVKRLFRSQLLTLFNCEIEERDIPASRVTARYRRP